MYDKITMTLGGIIMEKLLWIVEGQGNFLISPEDVRKRIFLGDWSLIIEGVDTDSLDVDALNQEFQGSAEELEDFFESKGMDDINIVPSNWYMEVGETLIYDTNASEFYLAKDGQEVEVYEWWDGSNKKFVINDGESITTHHLILTYDYVSLDEWNGSDYNTNGVGHHQYVYKVLTLDGEPIRDLYLIVLQSQWQGEQDQGKLLTLDELKEHLKDLERNVDEYMELLLEIEE